MIWCGVRAVVLHQRRRPRFSRSGDPATGDFGDAIVLKKFGEVPDDLRSTASAFPTASSRALRWKAIGSLSVTLRAQPRDATVSVYPVLCISFAFQAGDFSDRDGWIFGQDFPVVFCLSNDSEGHLYFCHAVPCMEIGPKRTRLRRAASFEVMPQTGWQPVWISTSIFSTVCID